MSTSESYSGESSTSVDTDVNLSDNYELEVEPEELESASDEAAPSYQEDKASRRDGAVVLPYDDEPIADEEWVRKYEEDKEREKIRVDALQERLDGVVPTSHWCKCNNCDISLLQNVYETQCCQEIERCVKALCSDEVLQDVETPPSCVTHHPGFRVNCLEKWSLRLSASKYRTKDRRRYRQSGSEQAFLRSISYREFSQLVYGTLGRLRIPLPSCVYQSIRTKFNTNGDEFTGFEEDDSD